MVDNFDLICEWLDKQRLDDNLDGTRDDGDVWYIQLLRRQSDDPMTDGIPDPAYHGNMHSRSLKDYLIHSSDKLKELKHEITTLCDVFNVRAYVRLNKRNYKNISLRMLKDIATQVESGGTYSSPYHLVASANGGVCQARKKKVWLLDLDAEYLPYENDIIDMVLQCEPHKSNLKCWKHPAPILTLSDEDAKKAYLARTFFTLPSKSGKHIHCKPFNKAVFKSLWEEYTKKNLITAPVPQVKFEPEMLHFSMTGKYLKKTKDFAEICKKFADNVKVDKIDKNKNIVHANIDCFDALEEEWRKYCLENEFWMKCFDIHPDNPTILYVP